MFWHKVVGVVEVVEGYALLPLTIVVLAVVVVGPLAEV
jgi:hypothetical protein